VGGGNARIETRPGCPTPGGQPTYGLALNLERDSVGSVILGEYEHISEEDVVKCIARILEVPVGTQLIGRVVNPLGAPIDGKCPINAKMTDCTRAFAWCFRLADRAARKNPERLLRRAP